MSLFNVSHNSHQQTSKSVLAVKGNVLGNGDPDKFKKTFLLS